MPTTPRFIAITSKEDSQTLQSDHNALKKWSDEWLLRFHPDKCHVVTLGKFENIMQNDITFATRSYNMFEEKDLGVIIDSELSFSEHILSKVRSANTIVGLIRRSFSFLDGILLLSALIIQFGHHIYESISTHVQCPDACTNVSKWFRNFRILR